MKFKYFTQIHNKLQTVRAVSAAYQRGKTLKQKKEKNGKKNKNNEVGSA